MERITRALRPHVPAWAHMLPLVCALAMLSAAFVVHWLGVRPAEQRLSAVRAELRAAETRRGAESLQTALTTAAPAYTRLQMFRDHFDREETLSDWLVIIHATADAVGLRISEARYRHVAARAGSPLSEVRMTFPVRGSFGQIERFAGALLARIPVMSVERLQLTRAPDASGAVDAQLELALFMKP